MESTGKRRIYTLGEIVYDIIFKNGQPVAARPGGSMLNSAVSLGRKGLPVSFIGTCGRDNIGSLVSDFLSGNKIDVSFLHRENSKSIIALAFLDENNNASYSFYKGKNDPESPVLPSPERDDIVLFGSFYSLADATRDTASRLVKEAGKKGTIIIYDPNFRETHIDKLQSVYKIINDNILRSTIVRGSDVDFNTIFGTSTAESTWELPCFRNCAALIYTRAAEGVDICTKEFREHFPVPAITPVSTIGAGDSFNAGIITAIYGDKLTGAGIYSCSGHQWQKIIETGISFASEVCMSYDNYISTG